MTLFNEQELDQLAQTVSDAEKRTDAEIVTVLTHASDNYRFIPTLWAAMLALLTPATLNWSPFWLERWDLIIAQLAVFTILALMFQIPALRYYLIPKKIKKQRAALMARRLFLEQGVYNTKDRTGVLIFVSEVEHYVEIMVDKGISDHIGDSEWQEVIATFTQQVKAGKALVGFEQCVINVTDILSTVVPATSEKNELENRLVVI